MWSLVTENGKSTDVRTEKLPNTIDPQYMVGYNWARQPALRLQQKFGHPYFGNSVTVAMSLEQAETQLATTANAPANYIFGGPGTGGGLFNTAATYANNVAPDVIAKIAFDGTHSHVEVGGLARFFRDEYAPIIFNPTNGATVGYQQTFVKDTKTAGGVFGTARVSPSKYLDVAFQGMAGGGVGRYGSSQLGDVTVHPDGTLAPIKNYHGLFSLETHPAKKLDLYAYYGGEYAQRTVYFNRTGALVGYGVPNANDSGCFTVSIPVTGVGSTNGASGSPSTTGPCTSPTRYIQEGTIGYTYRLANSPKFGRLQYQMTYSYLTKAGWVGLNGTTPVTPRATNNLIYAGMRYYIP